MSLADAEEIIFHLLLADTNLGTVSVQAEHLNRSVRVNPYVPIISQQVSMNRISPDSLFFQSDYSVTLDNKSTTEGDQRVDRVNTLKDKNNL